MLLDVKKSKNIYIDLSAVSVKIGGVIWKICGQIQVEDIGLQFDWLNDIVNQ